MSDIPVNLAVSIAHCLAKFNAHFINHCHFTTHQALGNMAVCAISPINLVVLNAVLSVSAFGVNVATGSCIHLIFHSMLDNSFVFSHHSGNNHTSGLVTFSHKNLATLFHGSASQESYIVATAHPAMFCAVVG